MEDRTRLTIIEKEMQQSYLDYSMSVIVSRALPDIRDGLKPVHRRILFSMNEAGLKHNTRFKKSANVVGDVLGKYHPHGDSAVYDALVRMAQPFSLRYPLVLGQGNMGSIDGDSAAAYRYTEAKLAKIAQEMLDDLDKETVEFVDNFDGSRKEPAVLPSKIPNLLINGSSGIAVGMATNIPSHNLLEVCSATIALVENDSLGYGELMNYIHGPDFPTGGIVCGATGIREMYKDGRGKIILRAKCDVEGDRIIVREIPYQVNKSLLLENIAELVKEKIVEGISDLRDESDKEGLRIVIEVKENPETVLNQLYKHSQLQVTFGANMLALVDGEPRVLGLKEILSEFLKHRRSVIVNRTRFDLRVAEERVHIIEGLLVALRDIDSVVSLVKKSSDVNSAKQGLMKEFMLSELQAQAILDMKLQKLTSMESTKIASEHKELLELIAELKGVLASDEKVKEIIKNELKYLKDNYGDLRRTEIRLDSEDIESEDLVAEEKVVITLTHKGYVKRLPLEAYRSQKRGGKGIVATGTREEDFVESVLIVDSHDYLLFFSDSGRVHWLKAYQVPEGSRYAKGVAIVNLLKLGQEKVSAVVGVKSFDKGYIVMATRNGVIKKSLLSDYSRPRVGGIVGINLRGGDSLVDVKLTDGLQEIIIATNDGRAVHFKESDVSVVGRSSMGARGIRVRDSFVVGMEICSKPYLLTVTENGFGKRTAIGEYRLVGRGGSGVTNIKITQKNGKVIGVKEVCDSDEIVLISKKGIMIRTPVNGVSVVGRMTQGVRLIRLSEGDSLVSVAVAASDVEEVKDFTLEGSVK